MSECLILSNTSLFRTASKYLPLHMARQFYDIVASKKFMEDFENDLNFYYEIDKNGHRLTDPDSGEEVRFPTFESAMSLILELEKTDPSVKEAFDFLKPENTKRIIDFTQKTINETFQTAEAVDESIARFNTEHPFRDRFILVPEISLKELSDNTDNKLSRGYKLVVKERNATTEQELIEIIKNIHTKDKILKALTKAGIPVEYIKNVSEVDLKDISVVSKGLKTIINIETNSDSTELEARAAARFALIVLKNHPLLQRYLKYAEKNNLTQQEIELYLVDAFEGNLTETKLTILHRFWHQIKKIFGLLKESDIREILFRTALKIAKGFISGKMISLFESENISYNYETTNPNKSVLNLIEMSLNELAVQMKEIDVEWYQKIMNIISTEASYKALADNIASNDSELFEMVNLNMYLAAIATTLTSMADSIENIQDMLEEVDVNNISSINDNRVAYAKKLRAAHEFCESLNGILLVVEKAMPSTNEQDAVNPLSKLEGDIEDISLDSVGLIGKTANLVELVRSILNKVNNGENSLLKCIKAKERVFCVDFLKSVMGEHVVEQQVRIVFNNNIKGYIGRVRQNISPEQALSLLQRDNSWAEMYLTSMSNNSDLVGSLVDKVIKQFNTRADALTTNLQDRLRLFREECLAAGYKEGDFLEEDADGKITGNILTPYNWNEYEKDFKEFKDALKAEFFKQNPHILQASDVVQGVYFNDFAKKKIADWHNKHSYFDASKKMFVPAIHREGMFKSSTIKYYDNEKYNKLEGSTDPDKKKLFDCLKKYRLIKEEIDEVLPSGSTKWYRMPLFRGTFTQRAKNAGYTSWDQAAGSVKALRTKISELYTMDSDDYEYGSVDHYNTIEEDMFENKLEVDEEKIKRLPLYGINKVKDPSVLSRDIFFSTLAYGSMAYSHNSLSEIVDSIELVKHLLMEREVVTKTKFWLKKSNIYKKDDTENGEYVVKSVVELQQNTKLERNLEDRTRAFKRFTLYLNLHLYGVSVKPFVKGGIAWNKVAMLCSKIASAVWLGGNVHSATVNVGTGAIEIFKEAGVGLFYSMKDWTKAHVAYYSSIGANLMQFGKQDKDDKISLFILMFDARGENSQNFKNWRSHNQMVEFLYNRSLYMPYAAGEHYMQTIPFLAMAFNQEVYVLDNDVITKKSLFDAYETEYLNPEKAKKANILNKSVGVGPKRLKLSVETTFKDEASAKNYQTFVSILEKYKLIKNKYADDKELRIFEIEDGYFTLEELDLIKEYKLPSSKITHKIVINNTISKIEEMMNSSKWSINDIGAFKAKAREVCNRMHGVYNREDKILLQLHWFWNMFMSMKGYAVGLATRRFISGHYNTVLDSWSEGSLLTAAKALTIAGLNLFGFFGKKNVYSVEGMSKGSIIGNCLLGLIWPANKKALKKIGFMEDLIYNLKRNSLDLSAIITLFLGIMLTAGGDDDDDDNEYDFLGTNFKGLAHYFITRWFYEQAAFSPIGVYHEIDQFTKGWKAIPGIAVTVDLLTLILQGIQTGWHFYKYDPYDETRTYTDELLINEVLPYKADPDLFYLRSRKGQYNKYDSKFLTKLLKMLPYWKSSYVWSAPYTATTSFRHFRDSAVDPVKLLDLDE